MRIPNWYRVDADGLRYYQAWNFHASGLVRHGFSTRIGGASEMPFDTLNLGLAVEDNPEKVIKNRQLFAAALDIDLGRIVVPKQVHGNTVRVVTEMDAGCGSMSSVSTVAEVDALITNVPNLPLALHFADCVSIFFLDPVNKAIGMAHAGWKGTAAKIVTATVEAMMSEFGSDPKTMLAAIGPAIGRCCFEVAEDAAKPLFQAFPYDERVLKQLSTAKWRADLKTANLMLLIEAGFEDRNIAISEKCTSCNGHEFFSYRRDGETGRMGGWMSLV